MTLGKLEFQKTQQAVHWEGVSFQRGTALEGFVAEKVYPRLADTEGQQEFEAQLRSLSLTGFGRQSLEEVLAAQPVEEREWAMGEAFAEAWLSHEHQVIWPWNMERDKRNARASLPGADLIGFVNDSIGMRLALGEVKSSSEAESPPQIMSGRNGHMGDQLNKLASELETVAVLIKWLFYRCKNTKFELCFQQSATLYCNSGNKTVSLYGVLIRDTQPSEHDLHKRGKELAKTIHAPTTCRLVALYLPFKISELPDHLPERKPA